MSTGNSLEFYANRNRGCTGIIGEETIGEGKYKYVTKGEYDSNGEPMATKFLKTGTVFSSNCFLDDIRASEAALPYVAGFIDYIDTATVFRGRVSIKLNMPTVGTQTNGSLRGQKVLCEPFILNFQKFNSNSGAADLTAAVAQALSHYSYHASDGAELLCDLQGGKVGNSYILSDVVVMSKGKVYGNTDLGVTGIETWLSAHQCTQFCCPGWKNWSGARRLIQPVFSSTTTLDMATSPPVARTHIRLRPSSIMFTQDTVKDTFQDGNSLHGTILQIARQDVGKRDIRMITVLASSDGRYFALDNRRLAVFRILEMCDRVRTIKVEVVPVKAWTHEWNRKLSTTTDGEIIKIRGGNNYIGRTEQETYVPWNFNKIRYAQAEAVVKQDNEFSTFLANFTDE